LVRTASPAAQARYDEHKAIKANTAVNAKVEWRAQDEARNQPVLAGFGEGKKYLFRSLPGTLPGFAVRIPTPPDDYANDQQRDRYERDFKRRRLKLDGENPPYDFNSLREKVGGSLISFKYIPGTQSFTNPDVRFRGTCFYATDDDEIYAFLMKLKKDNVNGVWSNITVEYPTRMVEVNGQSFPATSAGWEAVQAAMSAVPTPPQDEE
jgi:hypothetical protein